MVARLLQLTTVEMEERVRSEVNDNPALESALQNEASDADENYDEGGNESEEELIIGDYRSEDDIPDYKLNGLSQSTEQQASAYASILSFYDYLQEQLREQPFTEEQMIIGEYLIGSLDEDGLLNKPLITVVDELSIYHGIETDVEAVEEVLKVIQLFDPAGIGARNLHGCLLKK